MSRFYYVGMPKNITPKYSNDINESEILAVPSSLQRIITILNCEVVFQGFVPFKGISQK